MFFFFFLVFIHLAQLVKEPACLPMQEIQETQVQSLGLQDSLEREMATHFSILVREIPWTEEPGGLQSMGLQKSQGRLNKTTPSPAVSTRPFSMSVFPFLLCK